MANDEHEAEFIREDWDEEAVKAEIAAKAVELIEEHRRREARRIARNDAKQRGPLPADLDAAPVHKAAVDLLGHFCPPEVVELFKVILDVQDGDETPSLTVAQMNAVKLDAASNKYLTDAQIAREVGVSRQAVRKMRDKPEYREAVLQNTSTKLIQFIEINKKRNIEVGPEIKGAKIWNSYKDIEKLCELTNFLLKDLSPTVSIIDSNLYTDLRKYVNHLLEHDCVPPELLKIMGNRETGN